MTQVKDKTQRKPGSLKVIDQLCDYCGMCVAVCPVDCIELKEKQIFIDLDICTMCMNCVHACPIHIIKNVEN